MDESDSDRDDQVDRSDDVLYPLEGKFIDERDRASLMRMSEVERERLLNEREEEMQQKMFKVELARRVKISERETTNLAERRKRKASSVEPDDSQRKSSRQKIKSSQPLEAYKREREQRGKLRKRQNDRTERDRRSLSHDKAASDVDAEGESEVEWDKDAKSSLAVREEAPPNLNHFEAVRVGRGLFHEVCFFPGFEEAMVGCFVRVGTGVDHSTGKTLYKMAQIKGFSQGKPYGFEGKGERKIYTDQYAIAQHGSIKKEWNFSYLSNGRFTEADLETYKKSQAEHNLRLPSRSFLEQKYYDIKGLENRHWTDADIQQKIDRQNKYMNLATSTPKINLPQKVDNSAQRLWDVNRANRKANQEQIRKALIEERRAQLREREAREKKAKQKEEEEKSKLLKLPKSNIDDLFEGSDRSRSGTPAVTNKASGKNTPAKPEKKGGIPTFKKRNMDDDIISTMDLGIEIDI
ncbi:hypothetical protein K432DRAFT_384491 [Lepidopterella palustris CBS 459.81]|uniref:Plus3 domain-containing protein n=1 Tax=Lepidopterella palustris CBS 459.81 TaxID=1314670 RepID=A0A8E2E5F1_9PEZI|nr:hypothetical protein K432DRAFT_384491 [Lepidopterella palustris CBS 459.81]